MNFGSLDWRWGRTSKGLLDANSLDPNALNETPLYSNSYHNQNLLIFFLKNVCFHRNDLCCLFYVLSSLIHQYSSYDLLVLKTFLLMPIALLFLLMVLNPTRTLLMLFFDKPTSSICSNHSFLPYTLPCHYFFLYPFYLPHLFSPSN